MKLILAIVNNSDVKTVSEKMMQGGFSLTRIGSTGGILKSGNTTLISAVHNERVDKALEIIKTSTHARKYQAAEQVMENTYQAVNVPNEIVVGGATVFVLNIEDSFKF